MKKVLVAYCTNSGSTAGVAEAIGEAMAGAGLETELKQFGEIDDLAPYSAVIIGGPMILGWHRRAIRFLRRNRLALSRIPSALFFVAMQVTKAGEEKGYGFPVLLDPGAAKEPAKPGHLAFKERLTTTSAYLRPVRRLLRSIRPVSAAFLAGKLDYRRLGLFQMLFVMLVIGARPGDFRNWDLIRTWAGQLGPLLLQNKGEL